MSWHEFCFVILGERQRIMAGPQTNGFGRQLSDLSLYQNLSDHFNRLAQYQFEFSELDPSSAEGIAAAEASKLYREAAIEFLSCVKSEQNCQFETKRFSPQVQLELRTYLGRRKKCEDQSRVEAIVTAWTSTFGTQTDVWPESLKNAQLLLNASIGQPKEIQEKYFVQAFNATRSLMGLHPEKKIALKTLAQAAILNVLSDDVHFSNYSKTVLAKLSDNGFLSDSALNSIHHTVSQPTSLVLPLGVAMLGRQGVTGLLATLGQRAQMSQEMMSGLTGLGGYLAEVIGFVEGGQAYAKLSHEGPLPERDILSEYAHSAAFVGFLRSFGMGSQSLAEVLPKTEEGVIASQVLNQILGISSLVGAEGSMQALGLQDAEVEGVWNKFIVAGFLHFFIQSGHYTPQAGRESLGKEWAKVDIALEKAQEGIAKATDALTSHGELAAEGLPSEILMSMPQEAIRPTQMMMSRIDGEGKTTGSFNVKTIPTLRLLGDDLGPNVINPYAIVREAYVPQKSLFALLKGDPKANSVTAEARRLVKNFGSLLAVTEPHNYAEAKEVLLRVVALETEIAEKAPVLFERFSEIKNTDSRIFAFLRYQSYQKLFSSVNDIDTLRAQIGKLPFSTRDLFDGKGLVLDPSEVLVIAGKLRDYTMTREEYLALPYTYLGIREAFDRVMKRDIEIAQSLGIDHSHYARNIGRQDFLYDEWFEYRGEFEALKKRHVTDEKGLCEINDLIAKARDRKNDPDTDFRYMMRDLLAHSSPVLESWGASMREWYDHVDTRLSKKENLRKLLAGIDKMDANSDELGIYDAVVTIGNRYLDSLPEVQAQVLAAPRDELRARQVMPIVSPRPRSSEPSGHHGGGVVEDLGHCGIWKIDSKILEAYRSGLLEATPQSTEPRFDPKTGFMKAAVLAEDLKGLEVNYNFNSGDSFLLGRHPSSAIHFSDTTVSGQHLWVFHRNGAWYVEDLGSSNGTRLNHESVIPKKSVAIKDGDTIQIGREIQIRISIDGNDLSLKKVTSENSQLVEVYFKRGEIKKAIGWIKTQISEDATPVYEFIEFNPKTGRPSRYKYIIPDSAILSIGERGGSLAKQVNREMIHPDLLASAQFKHGSYNQSGRAGIGMMVRVDFSEPKLRDFITDNFSLIREQVAQGRLSKSEAAHQVVSVIASKVPYDYDRLDTGIEKRLYSLSEFIETGVCNERGMLTQIALQFVGIESRLEKGPMQGGRHAWVNVTDYNVLMETGGMKLDPQWPELSFYPSDRGFNERQDDGTAFQEDKARTQYFDVTSISK